jgi:predicted HTH domain antitoxin
MTNKLQPRSKRVEAKEGEPSTSDDAAIDKLVEEIKTRSYPFANSFRMADAATLRRWAENIKANGLDVPIWVDAKGLIVDGRNRAVACQIAGRKPSTQTYDGHDIAGQIRTLNIQRRREGKGEWQMVAGRWALELSGGTNLYREGGRARKQAALAFGIGEQTVVHAVQVLRRGIPLLVEAVEQDKISVSNAAQIAKLSRDEQEKALAKDRDAREARNDAKLQLQIRKLKKAHPRQTAAAVADAILGDLESGLEELGNVTRQWREKRRSSGYINWAEAVKLQDSAAALKRVLGKIREKVAGNEIKPRTRSTN